MTHWACAPRLATVFALALALVAGCTEVPATKDTIRAAEENGTFRKVCGVGIGPEQRRLKLDAFFNENIFEPRGVFFTASPEYQVQIDPKGFPSIKPSVYEGKSNIKVQMHEGQANCYYELTGFQFNFLHPSVAQNPGDVIFANLEDENDFLVKISKFRTDLILEAVDVAVLRDRAVAFRSSVFDLAQ